LASGRSNGRDGLVAGRPKLAEGKNKSGDTVKFESRWDLAMSTPLEGFPFIPQRKGNGHPNRLR
jgi:hypothetical protein